MFPTLSTSHPIIAYGYGLATRNASPNASFLARLTGSPRALSPPFWLGLLAPWDWRWSVLVKGRVTPLPPSYLLRHSISPSARLPEASRPCGGSLSAAQAKGSTMERHSIGTHHSIHTHIKRPLSYTVVNPTPTVGHALPLLSSTQEPVGNLQPLNGRSQEGL